MQKKLLINNGTHFIDDLSRPNHLQTTWNRSIFLFKE